MKQLLNLITILLFSAPVFAQDFKAKFDKYCQEGDTTKQLETLINWELEDPRSPALFTSYFNYYFLNSRQEILSMTTEEPQGESLALQDSTGETAGYIGGGFYYKQEVFNKGLEKIDQGIALYPDRLDMRFGKAYALGQAEDWQRFTDEIVKAIQYSSKNDNQWTWANNAKKENGKEFFLSSLQDYQVTLYNTGSDDLLVNMRTIAQEVLKYYPNHIESLSNLSLRIY